MIRFDNISKTFQQDFWKKPLRVLNNLSFEIGEGEITGFLGANGAGKTTSLKVLMNFISASTGNIIFSSKLGEEREEIFSQIGYMPERPYYYSYLSGREMIDYMGRLCLVSKSNLFKRTSQWAKRLDLEHALDRKVSSYSKGMLQRLGLICALIHDPMILILDEPLSGLDPIGRRDIKDILIELNKAGKTIFFSSHIISDIEEVCESIVILERGHQVYTGTIRDILEENKDTSYDISLKNRLGGFESFVIAHENKNEFIKDKITNGEELLSLSPRRLSLEDVIYKIRGNIE